MRRVWMARGVIFRGRLADGHVPAGGDRTGRLFAARIDSPVSPDESGPCGPCGTLRPRRGHGRGKHRAVRRPVAHARGVEVAQGATPDAGAAKSLAARSDAAFAFCAGQGRALCRVSGGRAQGQSAFAFYKAAQVQLLKSRLVLAAALRKPGMSGLPCLRRGDGATMRPAGWPPGSASISPAMPSHARGAGDRRTP